MPTHSVRGHDNGLENGGCQTIILLMRSSKFYITVHNQTNEQVKEIQS